MYIFGAKRKDDGEYMYGTLVELNGRLVFDVTDSEEPVWDKKLKCLAPAEKTYTYNNWFDFSAAWKIQEKLPSGIEKE